jgi:hypothetical protein
MEQIASKTKFHWLFMLEDSIARATINYGASVSVLQHGKEDADQEQ